MPVYLDLLVLLNFIVDLLLLVATNRLSGHPNGVGRAVLGSLLGGVYGGACVIPGMRFLGGTVWRLVFLGLIGMVAFGFNRYAMRRCVVFVLLSMALGGVAVGLDGGGAYTLILSAGAVCAMCLLGFRGKLGKQYVPVEIRSRGATVRFTALLDTGNALVDPISGKQVLVVSSRIGSQLTGLGKEILEDPAKVMGELEGGRLIPFHAVGRNGGLLAAKRYEEVRIGGRCGSCLVAFAPNEVGQGQPYEALTGGVI